jgi:hypothetical protein
MDGSGRVINSWRAVTTTFAQVLSFTPGIYFLQVADPERLTSKTIKVIIL